MIPRLMIPMLLLVLLLLSGSPTLAQSAGEGIPQGGNAPTAASEGPILSELLKVPAYASAWRVMLAGENPPEWVQKYATTLDGPPTPSIPVPLLGETYSLGFTCKPHDCADNQLYVLFAPDGRDAWGLLATTADGITWLGQPEKPIQDGITGALRR